MDEIITLKYENGIVRLLDQTLLPNETKYLAITDVRGVREAICSLRVRGAPAIGVCAAYGLVIAANAAPKSSYEAFEEAFMRDAEYLASSRPTAVNLFWAIERMKGVVAAMRGEQAGLISEALLSEAQAIEREDKATNLAIGENLLSLLRDGDGVLTHCNAGVLATSGYGTALSPFYLAMQRGMKLRVYADETRPLLQGARLTAYELHESGVDVTLICDNMAAVVMASGLVQAVIVGCDRVAANGDTANKIGTLGVSILAKYYGIPLYIAAPTSTLDLNCASGHSIPIEQRSADEVARFAGVATAPSGVKIFNPAFDVTPHQNITAIVTEKGVLYPPFSEGIKSVLADKTIQIGGES